MIDLGKVMDKERLQIALGEILYHYQDGCGKNRLFIDAEFDCINALISKLADANERGDFHGTLRDMRRSYETARSYAKLLPHDDVGMYLWIYFVKAYNGGLGGFDPYRLDKAIATIEELLQEVERVEYI